MIERHPNQSPNGHEAQGRERGPDQAASSEPRKEIIERGQLYFLSHPPTPDTFSGYGLTQQPGRKDLLTGLLMVDRPLPADPEWLKQVEGTFGEYQLVAMTATGERGIACQMQIEPESLSHLRHYATDKAAAIQQALVPLLEQSPKPFFFLRWDEEQTLWTSEIVTPQELPPELIEVFRKTGPGCIPVETNIGVVHVCHAADQDIAGFANKPVWCQWQCALLPTAPVLRLRVHILDRPHDPYKFESFVNIGEEPDNNVLTILLSQESLYLAFQGEDFTHRFTKVIDHNETQREELRRLVAQAADYWRKLPEMKRDFDRAKLEFQRRFPL